MAYLLVWTEDNGDKNWLVYSEENEAYSAALSFRQRGHEATVSSTELADAGGPSGGHSMHGVTGGFRI